MKRSLMIAALLATTAATPHPVYAGPAIGFVIGTLGGSGALAGSLGLGSIGFAVGVANGAAFGATLFGGILAKTIVSLGLSALSAALAPGVSVPTPASRMANFAQPISYAEWVFGRTRKGGPLGFTGFQNGKRYYVPIIASHPTQGPVAHFLDETEVVLNADITEETQSNIDADAPQSGYGRIDAFAGGDGQAANAGLVAAFDQITTAHDFGGLSGAVLWASRTSPNDFSEVYPRGREWAYAPVWDGHNQIYDPRDQAHKYTNNAALVIAFWITQVLGQSVDWDDVAIEADVCDRLVTNAEGSLQPLWTINGAINDDQDFESQRAQLAAACDAFLYERTDGKVGFTVGRWIDPDLTLGPDDFWALELTEGTFGSDAPTEISASYIEPENKWREAPTGVWVETDSVRPIRDEPQLFMVNSHNQAARMCKRIAKTQRPKYSLRGSIGLMGYELLGKRFFRVRHPEMGIDAYFEIGELAREGISNFSITANSVEPADFDFVASAEEPPRPIYREVTSSNIVPLLTGVVATSAGGGQMDVSWNEQDDSLTQQLRLRQQGDTEWQLVTVPGGQRPFRISGQIDGATYEVQGKNRTSALRSSLWSPDVPATVTIVNNVTPPDDLVTAGATGGAGSATVEWSTANDPNQASVRIYRGASFAGATFVDTVISPANTDGGAEETIAAGSYTYWAVPVNGSSVEGTPSGPFAVTVL